MKRSVPFEFFGESQYLEFTIGSLREFERAMGNMSIAEIMQNTNSLTVLTTGLMVGLKHHYRNKPINFFDRKLEEFLDNGGNLNELFLPLSRAIMVSGIFGKSVADAALNADTEDDLGEAIINADGEPKNE